MAGIGDGDDAGRGIDGKTAAGESALSDQVTPGAVDVGGDAVMPTAVPIAAPSATLLAAALPSTGVDGATLPTPIVNVCELVRMPSLACTVML